VGKAEKNPVAKNLNKFNRPSTHKDRKKGEKSGDVKHKKGFCGVDIKELKE
jgi:hypothetical protein